MNTYKITAKPDIRKAAANWPALSEQLLAQAIADVSLRELSEDHFGRITVDVQLQRTSHGEALNEVSEVVEQAGYELLRATATEWISTAAQRTLIAAATFVFGTGASENPLVGLGISAATTLAAEKAGLVVDRVLVEYVAKPELLGDWQLTKVPKAGAANHQGAPGFAAA